MKILRIRPDGNKSHFYSRIYWLAISTLYEPCFR